MGNWTRRGFLAGSGVTAGALALGAACTSKGSGTSTDGSDASDDGTGDDFDPTDWRSVRDQFSLDPELRHYAAFVLAGHPRMVSEAIESHRRRLDRDPQKALVDAGSLEGDVRHLAGSYLGTEPTDVALTESTTAGLGLVYGGLRLVSRLDVITTVHDDYSTHEALRLAASRTGHQVRRIRLYDDPARATVDGMVGRIVDAVIPATRVVALTWVHSGTGVRLPIEAISRAIAEINAQRNEDGRILVCVDGSHGLGVEDRTVADLGVDFLIAGTHKWLFGPRGTGIVWGKPAAWARLTPSIPSFAPLAVEAWAHGTTPGAERPGQLATPGGYHSLEHRWALGEAFKFHAQIGRDRVAERTRVQATALKQALAEIGGVTVVTPMDPELSSGIVAVDLARRDPFELVELLRIRNIVASVGPHPTRHVRFGPSIVTTPDQGEELVESVAALA